MIKKLSAKILPDPTKVVPLFFEMSEARTKRIINMILKLEESETQTILKKVFQNYSNRHRYFEEILYSNYLRVEKHLQKPISPTKNQKLLLGSYFTKEYSISSAALFNPSMVIHPDQSGTKKDSIRYVMSLRAVGEGHISSIVFREGIIDKYSNVHLKDDSKYSTLPKKVNIDRNEMLDKKLKYTNESQNEIEDIVDSNYQTKFASEIPVNERVLFPSSKSECVGMEDVRFVRFSKSNRNFMYYGTYTAYNGRTFRTQLIETRDFKNFTISTLHGNAINDKGMALFPRKINNKYVITSRQDGENIFIMSSDDIYKWDNPKIIKTPEKPWEVIQLGNCGSPVETDAGWILLTHAVGPMRNYVISAMLLDLNDPSKIIGSLQEPLIQPDKKEREGYVPNVVYSCGSLVHNNNLIIPYGFSDSGCKFAVIKINELLMKLTI